MKSLPAARADRPLSDQLAAPCRSAGADGDAPITDVSPRWVAADKFGTYSGPPTTSTSSATCYRTNPFWPRALPLGVIRFSSGSRDRRGPLRTQRVLDLGEQAVEFDRLGLEVVAAGGNRLLAIARHGV